MSRNHRSCVTTTSALDLRTRWSANHWTPSTSRWLVGSSSTSRSSSCTRAAASETRRRSPPDRSATAVSRPRSWMPMPSRTDRTRASPAHSWVASPRGPITASPTVSAASSVRWVTTAIRRPPTRETRPESGSTTPVRISNRVVLPPPLRPTTPMRSPALTPSETLSSTCRMPKEIEPCSMLMRLVGAISTFLWGGPRRRRWRLDPLWSRHRRRGGCRRPGREPGQGRGRGRR